MNTQLLFCIKVNKQLVKLGKYFADFNFRGSQLTAKYRENWTTRKFPILRYLAILLEASKLIYLPVSHVKPSLYINLTFAGHAKAWP